MISLVVSYYYYHKNLINIWIHTIFVPILIFTLFSLLRHNVFHWEIQIAISFIIVLLYISIDPLSGILSVISLFSFYYINDWAYYKACEGGWVNGFWWVMLSVHLMGWGMLELGHWVFESTLFHGIL